jgi:hypothetical protein
VIVIDGAEAIRQVRLQREILPTLAELFPRCSSSSRRTRR